MHSLGSVASAIFGLALLANGAPRGHYSPSVHTYTCIYGVNNVQTALGSQPDSTDYNFNADGCVLQSRAKAAHCPTTCNQHAQHNVFIHSQPSTHALKVTSIVVQPESSSSS
ncbi:hypothetical protein PC129_g16435 [Phytophthora cactorum]|uniref:Uncharacterized protein n=1 Tax=Phytophthora cactorum TaxID=29920 RepID=A0A8T1HMV8_9STRA|nr:hypothetical protein PC111_g18457 [Phytophthora cactorum]KAG2841567.1 hypothetical protein PC113_g19003 [Phytophthora cactorum]KAG2905875.1 hypothetical protein PC117_g20643 [Phytophthora cactorum]KAG2984684.1 hypothetical protein PC119_g20336 [Phytophthora cactorum]KAG3002615.1 hypothetical protein PC120_g19618 [Phytophthora cactorum]